MSRVIVVEDSSTQAMEIQLLLQDAGFEVELCTNGLEALEAIGRQEPDLVLTDLRMPEMDGLKLVEAIREQHPPIPVVLMTAYGSEEIAAESLRRGAASYVPKRCLRRDVVRTLNNVLDLTRAGFRPRQVHPSWEHSESHFVLDNDPTTVPSLVNSLSESLIRLGGGDETDRIRINIALSEALSNAIHHGNLELSSGLREGGDDSYFLMAEERRGQEPYRGRRVRVAEMVFPHELVYVVRDEGPGFDWTDLPDPTDPANLERLSGRGLLLIRTFMDRVAFNETGNEITMAKRLEREGRPVASGIG